MQPSPPAVRTDLSPLACPLTAGHTSLLRKERRGQHPQTIGPDVGPTPHHSTHVQVEEKILEGKTEEGQTSSPCHSQRLPGAEPDEAGDSLRPKLGQRNLELQPRGMETQEEMGPERRRQSVIFNLLFLALRQKLI